MYWYMNKVVFGEWVQSELDKREMTIADLARLGDARNPVLWRIIKGERGIGVEVALSLAMGWTFFRCNCSWDTPICRY